MAWVEGKQIDLMPQDYDLLHFLYKRAGLLSTRKQVLSEGLNDPSELIHARSRLDSAMSRLRQKLEPDPDNPRYITTVRGQGYKLVK